MPDAARIAQATVLEVPVTIQGSKIVQGTDQKELFTESTKTTLTFDDGAVLHLKARVEAGQSVFLRNDQSGKEVLCKVLEAQPEDQAGYTDLQFTVPDPQFWGVPAEESARAGYTSDEHEAMEAPHESLAAIPNLESGAPAAVEIPAAVPETEAPPLSSALPASPFPEPEVALLQSAHEPEVPDSKDAEQLAAMMAKEARGFLRRAFRPKESKQIEEATPEAASKEVESKSATASAPKAFSPLAFRIRGMFTFTGNVNPVTLGIAATVLVAAVLGFAWHARHVSQIHSSNRSSANTAASTATSSAQSNQRANQQATPSSAQPSQTPTSAVTSVAQITVTTPAETGVAGRSNPIAESAAPVVPKAPVSDVETSESVLSSDQPSSQPPSGQAKHQKLNAKETIPAKIVSQPQPPFPEWAKDLDVDGVVKLDALIDEKGNVVETKPLSGPRELQHAAESAVGLWIFEPAMSGGKATATHMVLTIQFQR